MPDIVLTITMKEAGGIEVNGPINNKVLCFGLLTSAEHLIQAHDPKKQTLIHQATVLPALVK